MVEVLNTPPSERYPGRLPEESAVVTALDADVLDRIRHRDQQALSDLLTHYGAKLCALFMRGSVQYGSIEDIPEFMEEFALRVWHRAHTYQPIGGNKIGVWIYELTLEVVADRLQKCNGSRAEDAVDNPSGPRITQVELISATRLLLERLTKDFDEIYRLTPDEFEEFAAERFEVMGFHVQRVGAYNKKDGCIDLIIVPKAPTPLPIIGAAQIKHHQSPTKSVGPRAIREFSAVLGAHPFNVGVLITNTTFTPDAKWFAEHHAPLLRLRNGQDLRRWLGSEFTDEEEWREIPTSIELCPGVVVQIPKLKLPIVQ